MSTKPRSEGHLEPLVGFLSVLLPDDRQRFSNWVATIVKQDKSVCARFVEEIDEGAGTYQLMRRQADAGQRVSSRKSLQRFAESAPRTANAIGEFDHVTASILAERYWHLAGRRESIPIPSPSDFQNLAELLHTLAKAARDKKVTNSVRRRPGGNAVSPELAHLIARVAKAYARHFGIRPSAAGNGVFSRVVKGFFHAGNLGRAPEQSALRTILKDTKFDEPSPRRGRKAKSNLG